MTQSSPEVKKRSAEKNRGAKNARFRERYAADPELRERMREQRASYRERNKEAIAAREGPKHLARQRERWATDPEFRRQSAEKGKAWRERNKEKLAAQKQLYYEQNRDAISEKNRKYRTANGAVLAVKSHERYIRDRETRLADRMFRDHGLRPDDWAAMWDAQGGSCYLCGDALAGLDRRHVHVEHDHSCCPRGSSCPVCRRGLACNHCNTVLGHAFDDPGRVRRIADNLEAAQIAVDQRKAATNQQLTFELEASFAPS